MFVDRPRRFFVFASLLFTVAAAAQQAEMNVQGQPGAITLDVVVSPKSGPPVSGLQQQDFTILDNKAPQVIASFQAFRERRAPIEVILVVDDVNTGLEHVAYERSEMNKFLKIDGGHLANPTALAFLQDSGIKVQEGFSTDGNALSASLEQYTLGLHSILRSGGIYSAAERYQVSLRALYELATRESARPGRKFVVWISPGWPLLSGPGVEEQLDNKQRQEIFSDVVHLSTLLREARITLYSIDPLGTADFSGQAFYWQSFVKGVSKPYQADGGNLALQVLAVQSGGLALTTGNDLASYLQKCMADAQAYYEMSFVPALDQKRDDYHHIEVRVAKAGVTARTRQGYYSQP
jgi:VWFA-related protein